MNIRKFQLKLLALKKQTFGESSPAIWNTNARALNVAEEAGELTREDRLELDSGHFEEDNAKDAVGDIFIALAGYCIARGWDMEEVIEETWKQLEKRWTSGQKVGVPPSRRGKGKA